MIPSSPLANVVIPLVPAVVPNSTSFADVFAYDRMPLQIGISYVGGVSSVTLPELRLWSIVRVPAAVDGCEPLKTGRSLACSDGA